MTEEMIQEVKKNFTLKETNLSPYATKSSDGIRINDEDLENDIRPNFYHDISEETL